MKPEEAKEDQNIEIAQSEKEEKLTEMATGEKQADVYTEEGTEKLESRDAISPAEEGFMQGETDEGKKAKCATCGKTLDFVEDVIERELDEKKQFFCSQECADNYEPKENVPSE